MPTIVQVIDAQGLPHERYVESWSPHTPFGEIDLKTTDDVAKARRFHNAMAALNEWQTVSNVAARRPDGRPNKPLTWLSVTFEEVAQ